MTPRFETLTEKKLAGVHRTMSLVKNTTGELWKSFMTQRSQLPNTVNNDLISLQVYRPDHFAAFHPANEFEKWALAEVDSFENIPAGMEAFTLPGGLYAVFHYKGSSNDPSIFQYIFGTWLPASEYALDDRPHFEVLGAKYKNNDPSSEEEIWIPVRPK